MSEIDSPAEFAKLSPIEQEQLVTWCKSMYAIATRPRLGSTSYGMKHDFERHGGFYVSNGAFKGAMLAAKFRVVDESEKNWEFYIHPTTLQRRLHHVQASAYRRVSRHAQNVGV